MQTYQHSQHMVKAYTGSSMVVGQTLSPVLGVSYNHGGKGSAMRDYFLQLMYHSNVLPIPDVLHAQSL